MRKTRKISFRVAVYQARRLRLCLEMAQLGRKIARLKAQYNTLTQAHPNRKPRQTNQPNAIP